MVEVKREQFLRALDAFFWVQHGNEYFWNQDLKRPVAKIEGGKTFIIPELFEFVKDMKTTVLAVLVALTFSGCAMMVQNKYDPTTGKLISHTAIQATFSTSAVKALKVDAKTEKTSIGLGVGSMNSAPDAASLEAIARGMVQGMK